LNFAIFGEMIKFIFEKAFRFFFRF
jgi:hypothetical protein